MIVLYIVVAAVVFGLAVYGSLVAFFWYGEHRPTYFDRPL